MPIHHPLGFKQHPLEDAGIYYICLIFICLAFSGRKKAVGFSVEATMSATRQKSQWQVVTRLGGLCFGMGSWPHHIDTWNPNHPCFDWKRPCFGGSVGDLQK